MEIKSNSYKVDISVDALKHWDNSIGRSHAHGTAGKHCNNIPVTGVGQ